MADRAMGTLSREIQLSIGRARQLAAQRRAAAVLLARDISPTANAWARALIRTDQAYEYPLLCRIVER